MDITILGLIITALGIIIGSLIGLRQIRLAKVQIDLTRNVDQGNKPDPPLESPTTDTQQPNLINQTWKCLDSNLQDVLSLAYNQAIRDGRNNIKTRDFFEAIMRLKPEPLPQLLEKIPQSALPKPSLSDIQIQSAILENDPGLSGCVEDSLKHLGSRASLQNKLTPVDMFVDIVRYGTGSSVARLRTHGISHEKIDSIVQQLGWNIVER